MTPADTNRLAAYNFIIMRGIPGAGKSTFVKNNLLAYEPWVCSADDYFMNDGKYEFVAIDLKEAHAQCFRQAIEACDNHPTDNVVIDNTNISAVEIAPYIALANAYDRKPLIVTLEVDPFVAAQRCVHGVKAEKIGEMHYRLMKHDLPKYWPQATIAPNGTLMFNTNQRAA
jgi:predicted ABC-type ATPase